MTATRPFVHPRRSRMPSLLGLGQELVHILRTVQRCYHGLVNVCMRRGMPNFTFGLGAEQVTDLVQVHFDHLRFKRIAPSKALLSRSHFPQHMHGTRNQACFLFQHGRGALRPFEVRTAF